MLVKNKIAILLFCSFTSMATFASPVNINTASAEEVAEALKGIGPAKAKAISEYCHKTTCHTAEDLLSVKGIGKKTVDKISKDLIFKDH